MIGLGLGLTTIRRGGGGGGGSGIGFMAVGSTFVISGAADVTAPVISGLAAVSINENTTAVGTYTADETVSWTLTGADSAFFGITPGPSTSATLAFLAGRDFESPADAGANNVYNVTVTGTDAASNVGTRAVAVTIINVVNEDPETLSGIANGQPLRLYLDDLALTTVTGRQSVAALKIPGVDTTPTGVVYSTVPTIPTFTVGSGFTGDLENWDFRTASLVIDAIMSGTIRNCLFGGDLSAAAQYPIFILLSASCAIEYCTFDRITLDGAGPGTVINSQSNTTYATPTIGSLRSMKYCRFANFRSDVVKILGAVGGTTIEYNYFGSPHAGPAWNVATSYTTGNRVIYTSGIARQFVAARNNTGVTPPTTSTSTADWTWSDVHADIMTFVGVVGSATIRRNLFHFGRSSLGDSTSVVGLTDALRIERNTGAPMLTEYVRIEENVIWAACTITVGGSLSGGANHNGPVRTINNAISQGSVASISGSIFDEISGNIDPATDAAIVESVVRRNTITAMYGDRLTDTSARCYTTIVSDKGTLYWVFTTAATQPTLAQIKLGQNSAGTAALASGNFVPTGNAGDLQTWDATGLPSQGKPYLHAVYERTANGFTYSDLHSAGWIDLFPYAYATKTVSESLGYVGPRAGGAIHSLTVSMQAIVPSSDASSSETLFTLNANGFLLTFDPRSSATAGRRVLLLTQDSAGNNGVTIATPLFTLNYGVAFNLVATATQNQDSGARSSKLFINGVELASTTGTATGTGFFLDGGGYTQKLLRSISGNGGFPFSIRSAKVWHNQWLPAGDTSGLGAATYDFDGDAAFWNGATPVTGWTLTTPTGVWT